MKRVAARQANQSFSRLLAEVAAGKEVVITRYGRPVAWLTPYGKTTLMRTRAAGARRLLAVLRKGYHLGGRTATRDEMHER